MEEKTTETVRGGRTFDSAFGFSFSIAFGLLLFIAGLVISLTIGQGIGLIFGVPLLVIGLVIPLFMMRGLFKTNEVKAPCPNCGATIKTSDATLQLRCPGCQRVIDVREEKLILARQ